MLGNPKLREVLVLTRERFSNSFIWVHLGKATQIKKSIHEQVEETLKERRRILDVLLTTNPNHYNLYISTNEKPIQ